LRITDVFLTLVLLLILSLILMTGLVLAGTISGISIAMVLAGSSFVISVPLSAPVFIGLSTRQRE